MVAAEPVPQDDPPTLRTLPRRRRLGRALPLAAALIGAVGSCTYDAFPSSAGRRGGAAPREVVLLHATAPVSAARGTTRATPTPVPPITRRAHPILALATAIPVEEELRARTNAGTGYVTIDAYPWSRVAIDGIDRGASPIIRLPLSAGPHVVVLERPEGGQHSFAVDVRAGETQAERWLWE